MREALGSVPSTEGHFLWWLWVEIDKVNISLAVKGLDLERVGTTESSRATCHLVL